MRELPPANLQHLVNVQSDGWADGDVPTYDDGTFVPGEGGTERIVPTVDAAPLSLYVQGPHGVYDPGSGRTYIVYLGVERDCYIAAYRHEDETWEGPVKVGDYPLDADNDHGAPTVAVDHDGHIHVVWGSHRLAAGENHRHSKSDDPHDITAWTTTTFTDAGTYPQLAVTDDGDLLLFDRSGSSHGSTFPAHEFAGLHRSNDGGATWQTYTAVIDTTDTPESASDAYLMGVSFVAGLAHLTWVVARGSSHDGPRTNVYHATYDPADGTMRNAAGDDLGTVITWADHPDCLAAEDVPIDTARHLVLADGRILIAWSTGTLDSGESGAYTVHVSRWDGTSWSTVDTGIPMEWRFGDAAIVRHRGVFALLACTRAASADITDLGMWLSSDGALWTEAGTLLEGDSGEGIERVSPIPGDGPWSALVQPMPDGWARTNATADDMQPISAVTADRTLQGASEGGPHTHTVGQIDSGEEDEGRRIEADGEGGARWVDGPHRGSDEIADPDTTVVIAHGLSRKPEPGEIQVQPRNVTHDVVRHAVHSEDADEFTVTVDPAPGSTNKFEFGWLWVPAQLAVPPPFSPDDLSDLSAWYDAQSHTADNNDPVSQWNDLSGNARHLEQATSSRRPLYIASAINSLPAVRFDGTDDLLRSTGWSTSQVITMLAVIQHASGSVSTQEYLIHTQQTGGLSSTGPSIFINPADSDRWSLYAGSVLSSGVAVGTAARRITAIFNGGSSEVEVGATGNTGNAGTRNATNLNVGEALTSGGHNNLYFNGDVGEILIYNRALTSGERTQVEDYLASRWGL